MAATTQPALKLLLADKEQLRQIIEEQDKQSGFVPDPTMTIEKLRAMMRADGVRPEDNIASREIIRIREEE